MLDTALAGWIALAIIFILASVFSERTSRYGYVIIPIVIGFFAFIKWLPAIYISTVFPVVIGLGVITFLKEQFRVKLGGYGATGSLIWKIMSYMVVLQFAIIFVNGIAIFGGTEFMSSSAANTTIAKYTITDAKQVGTAYVVSDVWQQLYVMFTMVWNMWGVMWALLYGVLTLYPSMTLIFGLDPLLAGVLSMGVYLMFIFELFILVTRPAKQPEI